MAKLFVTNDIMRNPDLLDKGAMTCRVQGGFLVFCNPAAILVEPVSRLRGPLARKLLKKLEADRR